MKSILRPACVWALGLCASSVLADDAFQLDEVVVSAPSADATLRAVPHSVSIIKGEDIERAGSGGLSGLLSREAGLNLQSYFGRDKTASIDMRGLGATAASNVLVLVDGVRLNADDLSGADLSSVPLAEIERIEVLRGAGAVRYGDGAVGGIVNILTRRTRSGPPAAKLDLRAGAWGARDARFQASGASGPLKARVLLNRQDSDGYRDNDHFSGRDASFEVTLLPEGAASFLDLTLKVARHTDEYGLPGPVSAQAFAGSRAQRRSSAASPLDGGETDDRTLGARLRADFGDAGLLTVQLDHRERENPYYIGVRSSLPLADQRNVIDSTRRDLQVTHELEFDALGARQDLAFGYVTQSSDYLRRNNGDDVVDSSTRRTGELNRHAAWAETIVRLGHGVSINGGLRHDRAHARSAGSRYTRECQYIFIPFPVEVPGSCVNAFRPTDAVEVEWHNRASELGVSWQMSPALTLFAADSRHFRTPNVDEGALAAPDLRPQTGRTREAGFRARADALEVGLTLFRLHNEDEIYFDSSSGLNVNRNYDRPTVRTGAELEVRWRPRPSWLLAANAAYVRPRFDGVDADVPLVPRRTANVRVEWMPVENQRLNVTLRHVGRRFDGNDLDNRSFAPLPSYTVCDLSYSIRAGAATMSAGIDNVFNRVYSTLAYSETYYPMPERTAWVALAWRFE